MSELEDDIDIDELLKSPPSKEFVASNIDFDSEIDAIFDEIEKEQMELQNKVSSVKNKINATKLSSSEESNVPMDESHSVTQDNSAKPKDDKINPITKESASDTQGSKSTPPPSGTKAPSSTASKKRKKEKTKTKPPIAASTEKHIANPAVSPKEKFPSSAISSSPSPATVIRNKYDVPAPVDSKQKVEKVGVAAENKGIKGPKTNTISTKTNDSDVSTNGSMSKASNSNRCSCLKLIIFFVCVAVAALLSICLSSPTTCNDSVDFLASQEWTRVQRETEDWAQRHWETVTCYLAQKSSVEPEGAATVVEEHPEKGLVDTDRHEEAHIHETAVSPTENSEATACGEGVREVVEEEGDTSSPGEEEGDTSSPGEEEGDTSSPGEEEGAPGEKRHEAREQKYQDDGDEGEIDQSGSAAVDEAVRTAEAVEGVICEEGLRQSGADLRGEQQEEKKDHTEDDSVPSAAPGDMHIGVVLDQGIDEMSEEKIALTSAESGGTEESAPDEVRANTPMVEGSLLASTSGQTKDGPSDHDSSTPVENEEEQEQEQEVEGVEVEAAASEHSIDEEGDGHGVSLGYKVTVALGVALTVCVVLWLCMRSSKKDVSGGSRVKNNCKSAAELVSAAGIVDSFSDTLSSSNHPSNSRLQPSSWGELSTVDDMDDMSSTHGDNGSVCDEDEDEYGRRGERRGAGNVDPGGSQGPYRLPPGSGIDYERQYREKHRTQHQRTDAVLTPLKSMHLSTTVHSME